MLPGLRSARVLVVDTETTSLDVLSARLVGVSLSVKPREAYYVALPDTGETEQDRKLIDLLRPLLEDPDLPKSGQNVKYDLMVLANHGITLQPVAFDTMIASFLIEPGNRQHNLDYLALQHLGFKKIATQELLGKKGKAQLNMLQVDVETVGNYACEDADITYRLMDVFRPRIEQLGLEPLLHEIELPLIPVLAAMERTGVKLDLPFLAQLSKSMRAQSASLEAEIRELCGDETFNLNSPKQLGQVLFDKLEIHKDLGKRKPKKTKTGSYTTDARTLESFGTHPVIRRSWTSGSWKSSWERMWTRCPPWCGRIRVACTRPSTRPSPSRDACPRPTRIFRTSRSAARSGARSARLSSPRRRTRCCFRPTTPRSSYASWRTCPGTRICARRSRLARTSMPGPPSCCSTSSPTR